MKVDVSKPTYLLSTMNVFHSCLIRKSNFYDLSFYKSFDAFFKHMLMYAEASFEEA